MKITDVTLSLFEWKGLEKEADAAYGKTLAQNVKLGLLRVITDAGIEGNAFLGSSVYSAEMDAKSLISSLKPILLGKDPFLREEIYAQLSSWQHRRLTTLRAVGAVDIALWDIAGKAAGLPLYKMIGGFRDEIAAYASSQVLPSIEAYTREAAYYQSIGWKAYKIHPPTYSYEEDIAVCEAVRNIVGDHYPLMLDSMWSYKYPEALKVGHALEDMNYLWFEDPLPEHDIYHYQKLCGDLSIPVMATEYPEAGLDSYVPWLINRATDLLRGDVAVKGGITPVLKAARLAEAFNMSFEIHHGANSLNNVANLNIALAIKNCSYFEVMLPDINQKYGLCQEIEVDNNGMVHAFTKPGLGAEIDMELISANTTDILS